jgi:hypothetical protein
LDGFTDSDWGNSLSRKSTTGLLARYNRGLILWRSKLQKTVSLSSAEAEYYAASEMAIEIIYLRNLLSNMRLPQKDNTAVFEDNTACIEWSNHVMGGRERAKHIDIRKHFAHEAVQNGHMRLYKIPTEFQLADLLTKGLQLAQFEKGLYSLLGRIHRRRTNLRDLGLRRGGETDLGWISRLESRRPLEGVFGHGPGRKARVDSTRDPASESEGSQARDSEEGA